MEKTILDEESVKILDWAEIKTVDLLLFAHIIGSQWQSWC